MGHEVSVEPPLADGRYRPDFLARRGVESFYVEATVCGQRAGTLRATTNEADAVEKLRSALRNSEEEVHSDLWLKSEGKLNHTVSTKTIAKPFLDLLRNTVASEVRECYQSTLYQEDQPKYKAEFQCGDWTLECILRPKIQKHGVGQVWGRARTAVAMPQRRSELALPRRREIGERKVCLVRSLLSPYQYATANISGTTATKFARSHDPPPMAET